MVLAGGGGLVGIVGLTSICGVVEDWGICVAVVLSLTERRVFMLLCVVVTCCMRGVLLSMPAPRVAPCGMPYGLMGIWRPAAW